LITANKLLLINPLNEIFTQFKEVREIKRVKKISLEKIRRAEK